ncbi:CHAD domain-containing protein [Peterkaempfera bronchialis]|uniref:CHAD domain-containing protein n=1 Tax=Peterkaempfera bronchialis TaxID=2126346 RepID=UPI003C3031DF
MTDALSPAPQPGALPTAVAVTTAVTTAATTTATTVATTAGEVLTAYLTAQAATFLRALPVVRGAPGGGPGAVGGQAAGQTDELLRTVRRVGGALHTFAAMVEPGWARQLREELRWLRDLLTQEPSCNRRLARLLASLDSLTGTAAADRQPPRPGGPQPGATGMLAGHPGAAKARALLERQLTVARARVHTAALQELRSARLHALADRMALLTGEVPLTAVAGGPADEVLPPQAATALRSLVDAVESLPLVRAGAAYNGDALHRLRAAERALPDAGTAADADADTALGSDDAPWLRVRTLAERARCALEVCEPLLGGQAPDTVVRLAALGRVLERHQDACDAAATAATAARTPRITPATAYVLGVVHADQRLEVEAARYAFGRAWPDAAGSAWTPWPKA